MLWKFFGLISVSAVTFKAAITVSCFCFIYVKANQLRSFLYKELYTLQVFIKKQDPLSSFSLVSTSSHTVMATEIAATNIPDEGKFFKFFFFVKFLETSEQKIRIVFIDLMGVITSEFIEKV